MFDDLPRELAEALDFARVVVHRRVFAPADREDALSEAWLAILRCWECYDRQRAAFSTYSGDSADGAVLKWIERQKDGPHGRTRASLERRGQPVPPYLQAPYSLSSVCPEAEHGDLTLGDMIVDPATLPERRPDTAGLLAVLGQLPVRLRRLLWYRYWEGLSQRATGERLGLGQMHVSRLERRALAELRKYLLEQPEEV